MKKATKWGSYLIGIQESYLANAYDDAKIADYMLDYINQNRKLPATELGERTAQLIQITPNDRKKQRLTVQAFTQYWINGYADFNYVRLIGLLIPIKKGLVTNSTN